MSEVVASLFRLISIIVLSRSSCNTGAALKWYRRSL